MPNDECLKIDGDDDYDYDHDRDHGESTGSWDLKMGRYLYSERP